MENILVRYGNHWLLTDKIANNVRWFENVGMAGRYTREWAEKFQANFRGRVHLYTEEEVTALYAQKRKERIHWDYVSAFEGELAALTTESFYNRGLGCNIYLYRLDHYMAAGLTPKQGAEKFFREMSNRKVRKKCPSRV